MHTAYKHMNMVSYIDHAICRLFNACQITAWTSVIDDNWFLLLWTYSVFSHSESYTILSSVLIQFASRACAVHTLQLERWPGVGKCQGIARNVIVCKIVIPFKANCFHTEPIFFMNKFVHRQINEINRSVLFFSSNCSIAFIIGLSFSHWYSIYVLRLRVS